MNQPNSAKTIRSVIAASSVGTMIEWYDFYIFGMLSTTISAQFFPKDNPTAALLSTLAIFAAGFIVRPFGALLFGRLGDLIGRKYTFLLIKSPNLPNNNAPKGRTINPAAKIARVLNKAAVGLSFGKNWAEIVVDSIPNI